MVVDMEVEGRLIVAVCKQNQGIGYQGQLPWPRLSQDMRYFKDTTMGAAVLMGSTTYQSIPPKSRPLPGRLNIVLSSKPRNELKYPDSVLVAGSLSAAALLLKARGIRVVYIIGGESVYREALKSPQWSSRVYFTEIDTVFESDRCFPFEMEAGDSPFAPISISADITENGVTYRMKEYTRSPKMDSPMSSEAALRHEEYQYLDLVRRIINGGARKGDRTGTGTLSVFGAQMRFNLRRSFPLLTTKRVFWRGVAEELFWLIRGSTNANELSDKGIHIWDGNGSREFLNSRGFTEREIGDLGPVYGFQWRHFGAEYSDMGADYNGKGVDQLQSVINTIKSNPNDRRILLCAWNPASMDKMALPPCHLLAQFYVANGELSCQMYQRSCDMGLGVPFNIASYSLLTCLIAKVTGLVPGDFVHVLGDAHVYLNHIEALREQLTRSPNPFPTLTIRNRDRIEDFRFEDLTLENYTPHKSIAMKMAV
ncbi:putative bifunctional dihydrofolate reductase-thymidylate synthase [Gracilariopsis chorda]|uniref:Bifunctional dihydrofolate reductase-thymidylate synthase n=1 Tax=Gracilariopsis chorda TaxID=448386 RepID=A0A2V3IWJ2_9FLOR|nr:putative bifunctional dihydrofolate reductase-thymidylate synthase [Gracilariopsis chorda]|eukprot:PXF46514.1 putative bifunctional dihydrofolate reductase-thymidylate synthase [Gracilariopsis chorda]